MLLLFEGYFPFAAYFTKITSSPTTVGKVALCILIQSRGNWDWLPDRTFPFCPAVKPNKPPTYSLLSGG